MDTLLLPDAFYFTLDETPNEVTTLCALADWYEEQGLLLYAACVRWTIRGGLHPIRYRHDSTQPVTIRGNSWNDGWHWWVIDATNWAKEKAYRLPHELWDRLPHSFPYHPSVFKDYPTRRAAYEALFEAWAALALNHRRARKWEVAR